MIHTIRYKTLNAILLVAILLAAAACTDELRESNRHGIKGDEATVKISLAMPEMDIRLRSSLDPDDENHVYNAFLYIFNEDGTSNQKLNLNYFDVDESDRQQNTVQRRQLTIVGLTAGSTYHFAVVTNFSDNQKSFENSRYDITLDKLNAVETLDDLKNMEIQYAEGKESRQRLKDDLVMTGYTKQIIDATSAQDASGNVIVEIPIHRVDTKVTFDIKSGDGVTFIPSQYKVMRMAKKTALIAKADYEMPTPADFYFDDAEPSQQFDADGMSFTFYTLENLAKAKKTITGADPAAYKQRAKQEKINIDGATNNPKVKNGAFVNAPDNGTYVVLEGEFNKAGQGTTERYGTVRYLVHLGMIDGVNDYAIHRNTHYTYTITVNDIDDIIVEAKSDQVEVEPDPRHEGIVHEAKQSFHLDAHYEVINMVLDKADFPDSDPLKVYYRVKTPFDDNKSEEHAIDVDWLKFVVNTNTDKEHFMSYAKALNSGIANEQMYNIKEFIQKFKNQEAPFVFGADGKLYLTVFVDEYYYERNPNSGALDPTLWRKFANAPDREFVLETERYISPDGNSIFTTPIVAVRQRSIKTFYNTDAAVGINKAWGVESVEDDPDLIRYDNGLPTDTRVVGGPKNSQNWSYVNGRYNTMREWASVISSLTPPIDYRTLMDVEGEQGYGWDGVYDYKTNTLKLKKGSEDRPQIFRNARFGCLKRNRDTNGNGRIDPSEVKWYLPALTQLIDTWVYRDALPQEARIFSGVYDKRPYFSSTGYITAGNMQSNNTMTFLTEAATSYIASQELMKTHGYALQGKYYHAHYRCVRNLGIPTDPNEELQPKQDEFFGPIDMPTPAMIFTFDKENFIFDMSRSMPGTYRDGNDIVLRGELPLHGHMSSTNRPYKKFKVAKDLAKAPFIFSVTMRNYLRDGKSPCRNYSEDPGKADMGTWRVPNERELSIIHSLNFTDKDGKKLDLMKTALWSSTYNAFDNSDTPGLFMYKTGAAYNRISVKGLPLYHPSLGKVRCVRDIKD